MHGLVAHMAEALSEVDTAQEDVVEAIANVFASYGADTGYLFDEQARAEFTRIAMCRKDDEQ